MSKKIFKEKGINDSNEQEVFNNHMPERMVQEAEEIAIEELRREINNSNEPEVFNNIMQESTIENKNNLTAEEYENKRKLKRILDQGRF